MGNYPTFVPGRDGFRRTLNADYRPDVVEDGPVNGVGPGISLGCEFDAVGNLWKLRDGKQAEPPLRVYAYDQRKINSCGCEAYK